MRWTDEIEAMHAEAAAARGHADFGADDYREALGVLCASLDADARLTPMGELALRGMIVDALSARLDCEAGWSQHPEAADHAIVAPLVIVGLPRTGTTALHHLIAQDDGFQALEHWLMRHPKPRPPRAGWEGDPDFRATDARVRMIFERSPEMKAIHEIEADLPDECWNLFTQTFLHSSWEANADVTGFARWWAGQDLDPAYRRHRRNVQLIGHREPARRWLFKDATHLFDLDALLRTYPDAIVVQTHRDPVTLIPSVCSLCWAARGALNQGTDPSVFGASTLVLWERGIDAMMQARARHPATPFYDLAFDRFLADPIAAIAGIYDHFGLTFSAEAEAAMRRFRDERPKGRHGTHRYDLSDWGLDADEIRARFRDYTRAYDVRPEAPAA
jgi:Ni/Co efflux regulator RcnB